MSDSENNKPETTSTSPSPEKVVAPTDPAQLLAAVRNQVEYYFSKENLKNDSFLISKMDAQNSVAISTILTFAKLKALTEDESVVLEALKGSTIVSILDGRLKSTVKQGRNTIILREIPADTTEEAIREIFNYPGCKPITSIKSDIEDTWFVVMENEADAKDVVLDLKLKKRMFGGSPVKARLKSEAVVNRSYYPTNPPIASSIYPVMYPYGGAGGPLDMQQQFGAGFNGNQVTTGNGAEGGNAGSPRSEDGAGGSQTKSYARSDRGNGDNSRGDRRTTGGKVNNRDTNNSRGNGETNNRKGGNSNNNSNSASGNNSNNRSGNSEKGKSSRDAPAIDINSMNFPPLREDMAGSPTATLPATNSTTPVTTAASIVAAANSNTAAASTATNTAATSSSVINANTASFIPAAPTQTLVAAENSSEDYSMIGYGDKPFVKYQIDDIINIVKNIKEAVLPDTIHTNAHPLAMETSPNVDLLLRQRTFSIDETREQMQQGRPVQRDAVISGEVDYNSVMYGDEQSTGAPTGATTTATTKSQQPQKKKSGGSWAGVLKSSAATSPPPATASAGASKPPAARPAAPNTTAPPAKSAGKSGDSNNNSGSANKKGEAGKRGGSSGAGGARGGNGKGDGKKDGRNGNNRDQRGGNGRRNEQKGDKDSSSAPPAPSGPPLKWGDKPSFANVLKSKDEAKATPAPTSTSGAATSGKTQTQTRGQRSRSGSESSNGGKNHGATSQQVVTGEDGTWSKQKLPPLKKNDP